jgi:hypothetical protein
MKGRAVISIVLAALVAVTTRPALARAEAAPESTASATAGATAHEPGWKLRVPLAPAARVQPYVAISREPGEIDGRALPHRLTSSDLDPTRVAMGTGLRWKLDPRVELFGQYDLLSLRDSAGPADRGPELVERPGLSGGLSIRF